MGILGSDLNSKQDFTGFTGIKSINEIFFFRPRFNLQGYSLFYDDEDVG